ncbi:hypothetical protein BZARG_765 [Bizionia argentinensis JUB59]|uniref:Uncharacterized protein n=1 Tax=Bizionia argentinensis JUB59 TaxID=1046627 RepID=G2EB82_9FLAO|nr:hypothetical protein [Bizionia argentinensis]EGV44405.1 hypothetical protein BZARG_765 [Bizionia argentinensis JUB59]
MQTKKQSLTESLSNTAVGFGVSYASTFLIFPLLGIATNAGTNLIIVIYFTIISILRGYAIRRFFNKKTTGVKRLSFAHYPDGKLFYIHCFHCEIDTPVNEDKENLYCSNCGLKH